MSSTAQNFVGSSAAQRMDIPEKFGSPPLMSPARAGRVNALRGEDGVVKAAFAALLADYPLSRVPSGPINPFLIPNNYTDPTGSGNAVSKIRYDGCSALNFALRYYLTGAEDAAAAARKQIAPWLTVTGFSAPAGSDTRLAWSNTWPMFIAAGMLLRGARAWSQADHDALKAVTRLSLDQGIITAMYPSNQGAWGTVLGFASAALLEDRALFALTERQWKATFAESVKDNLPVHEIYRQGGGQGDGSSGLFYSNFLVCALTYSAEWARANGTWLYDYKTPDGSTLRGLHENVARWTRSPAKFPYNSSGTASTVDEIQGHYEILNSLWPGPDASWLVENKPVVDRYGLRYLTLTHRGQPLRG